jgi:hypothetical protein
LQHHQDFGPARQHWNIGGRKGGAGVEGEKQVIDEAGPLLILTHFTPKIGVQHHLRK